MLAAMFVAFILQIVFRYLLNFPIGWTTRSASSSGSGWCSGAPPSSSREREEIRFDLIYGAVGARATPGHGVITAVGA